MMALLSLTASTVLALLGLLHFYWAAGGKRGLEKALPSINGEPMFRPGRGLTIAVGLLLLGFSYIAYALHFEAEAPHYLIYAGWGLSLLFVLRAVGDFKAVGFFKTIESTPFAVCDTRLYSPLCLALGAVFALLTLNA